MSESIKSHVADSLNDVKAKLAQRIRDAIESRDALAVVGKVTKSTTNDKVKSSSKTYVKVTVDDIKTVKAKLKKISGDLEYPNENQDTYKNFLEIEGYYNDSLQSADNEFLMRFRDIMIDFEKFVKIAIGKIESKGLASNRSRSQALDILHDVEFFLANKYFPEITIKQQTSRISQKLPYDVRITDIIKKTDPGVINALQRRLVPLTEKQQISEIQKEFPVLLEDEASQVLDWLKLSNPVLFPPAVPAVPATGPPAGPATGPPAGPPAGPPKAPELVIKPGKGAKEAKAAKKTKSKGNEKVKVEEVEGDDEEDEEGDGGGGGGGGAAGKEDADFNRIVDRVTGLSTEKYFKDHKTPATTDSDRMNRYDELEMEIFNRLVRYYSRYSLDYRAKLLKVIYNKAIATVQPFEEQAPVEGSALRNSKSVSQINALKGKYDYSQAVQHTVKLLSFKNEFDPSTIKGSSSYRSMLNNSDYDMFEQIYENLSFDKAVKDVAKKMQDVVKRLMREKLLYIMDIKCGLDHDLEYNFPELKEGKIVDYNPKDIVKFLTQAFKKKLINEKKYKEGIELTVDEPNLEQYFELKDFIRKLKVIRWKPEEFVYGSQSLSNGRTKTLEDAIQDKTMIKIDSIAKVGGRLVEFSNIYEFWARNEPINALKTDYVKMVKDEIMTLYTFGKYMKMDKRVLLLARHYKKVELVEKLLNFLNGPPGALNKIKGDLEAIASLIEKYPLNLPWATICEELDSMRERFSNIYTIKIKFEAINDELYHLSTLNDTAENREYMLHTLNDLMEYVGDHLNEQALAFNKKINLEPLPKVYMTTE